MRFLVPFTALLIVGTQCGYSGSQNSYPTPPDSYVVPKASSYPTAPGAYATKNSYGKNSVSGYDDSSIGAPPAPPSDSQFLGSSSSIHGGGGGGSAPTYGGSLSSGGIAGGNALSYSGYNSASTPGVASESVAGAGASSGYRRRAKAKARARTSINRRFQRRPLQPIRRFHKKAKH